MYLASLKLSRGGWVVGKSNFNENLVVILVLDLDFGVPLRVCQFYRRMFLENNGDIKIVQTTAECNTDVSKSIEVSIFQLKPIIQSH